MRTRLASARRPDAKLRCAPKTNASRLHDNSVRVTEIQRPITKRILHLVRLPSLRWQRFWGDASRNIGLLHTVWTHSYVKKTLHKVTHMWMHWPKLDVRYHLKYSNSCKLCGCKFVYAYLWLVWCMPLRCCILQRALSNRSSDAVPLAWLNYTLDYIKCKCKDGWADCKDSHLPCWMGFHSFHTRTVRVESMSQTHLVQLHTHLA